MPEAVTRSFSVKKVFLKISQNSQENTCTRVSFLIKLQTSGNFFKKEALAQAFHLDYLLLLLRIPFLTLSTYFFAEKGVQ